MSDYSYSFADVTGTIGGPGGGGSIGYGSGIDDGGISIRYDELVSVKRGSDKGMTVGRCVRSGRVTIRVLINSPLVGILVGIMNATSAAGGSARNLGQNTITVQHTLFNQSHNLGGCSMVKYPDMGYMAENGECEVEFTFVDGVMQ